jgi:RNA polymerase sigma-70 factor, ECF subfamily
MSPSDEELMGAYAGGDERALRELFGRYAPMLARVAQRNVGSAADAHDIVQQTFLQLHRARRDYRREMRFRPWIMTIALNLSRDLLRRRGRRPETVVDEETLQQPEPPAAASDETSERCEQVRKALLGLPREQREVIELHWFEQLPFDEVARLVGITSGAARVRAHRGYVTLRRCLEGGQELTGARSAAARGASLTK